MQYVIDPEVRAKAKAPHELFMLNLAVFHLLLAPVALTAGLGAAAILLPAVPSSLVIAYTYLRARRAADDAPWFVMVQWQLALRRYRIVVIGYALTALILGAGLLVGMATPDKTFQGIVFTIFSRFGVMPTVLTVFATFVLESQAIYQTSRGEVPDGMVKRFPPPENATGEQAVGEAQ